MVGKECPRRAVKNEKGGRMMRAGRGNTRTQDHEGYRHGPVSSQRNG